MTVAEESAQEAGTDIRRKAVVRLGIAAIVTLLALVALWWLDQSGKEKPKSIPAAPSPIVTAPASPPPAAPEPAEPEPLPEEPVPPTDTEAKPVEPPPPPKPGVLPKPAATPTSPVKNETARTATVPRPAPAATPAPVAPPTAAQPAPTAKPGDFVVQLGVFSSPANAQQLVDRLKQQGIRAYTETRVHVGPFLNKAEAEKAQAELKRLGLSGIVDTTR
jgi:DedD protein